MPYLPSSRYSETRLMGEPGRLQTASALERAVDSCIPIPSPSCFAVMIGASVSWYSARLPDEKLMAVYFTDSDLLDHRMLKTSGWLALLRETEHTSRRVSEGSYSASAEPRVLAAHGARLDAVAGERWLAVGDAAAAYDPLSSYGISAALGSGFYAASAIANFFAGNRDALSRYGRIIEQAYAQYLIQHQESYALERRWPDGLFWRRRHEDMPATL